MRTGTTYAPALRPASTATSRVRFTARNPPPASFGHVVWANEYRSRTSFSYPIGMGIRFTQLDPEQELEVNRLVQVGGRLDAA